MKSLAAEKQTPYSKRSKHSITDAGCKNSQPELFLTRFADHFYVRNLHVAMLSVALLHAAVLRGIFRVFLHIVRGCIGDDPGRSHSVTHMLGEIHSTASHFPCASVISSQQEFFRAVTF